MYTGTVAAAAAAAVAAAAAAAAAAAVAAAARSKGEAGRIVGGRADNPCSAGTQGSAAGPDL
jgi:hypothetical protein